MFEQYKNIVIAYETRTTDETIRTVTCLFLTLGELGQKVLKPIAEILSKPNDRARQQRINKYISDIVKFLKLPTQVLVANMSEGLQDNLNANVTFSDCVHEHEEAYFKHLSPDAKAMAFLVAKLVLDENMITFDDWHRWSYIGQNNNSVKMTFNNNFKVLKEQVSAAMETVVHSANYTLSDIMVFLGQADYKFEKGTGKLSKGGQVVPYTYKEILQVARHILKPLKSEMKEQGKVEDIRSSLQRINGTYGRKMSDSFTNYSPALLHCKFGNGKSDKICQSATTAFTVSGLGYSFNTERFFDLYQKSPTMDIFCNEIIEQTDQEMCSASSTKSDKKPATIKTNGETFALRLLLNTPQMGRFEWAVPSLVVHSPYSIADNLKNSIKPSAGMHTTVVVTPHVTMADKSLLQADKSVRKCHSQEKDGNPLKLFKHYSRDNCEFECHLEKGIQKHNCVPWDLPKLDDVVRTCNFSEAAQFEETMKVYKEDEECPHCIDECYKVDYEYTIHTKPLENICKGKEKRKIYEAVKMEVNKKLEYNFLPLDYVLQEMGLRVNLIDSCFFYVNKNAALVDIHIGPAAAVQITRSRRVTFLQQLANLGE